MSIGNSIRRLLIVATVIVAFCIAGGSVYAADQVKVHMINVGNADSILVEYNGHYALIDGGFASHVGKNKDNNSVSKRCRLDKYETLSDALKKTWSDSKMETFYGRNLFSFYEHFDNDMKSLTDQNSTKTIMTEAPKYLAAFDMAKVDYKEKTDRYNAEMAEYSRVKALWDQYDIALKKYNDQVDAAYNQALESYNLAKAEWDEYNTDPEQWEQAHPGEEPPEDPGVKPKRSDFEGLFAKPEEPFVPRPTKPTKEKTILSETEWSTYSGHESAFENVRKALDRGYKKEENVLRTFMELQNTSVIKAENSNSTLFKYYSALGYQYISQQIHQYMKGDGGTYVSNNFNDCLTYLNKRGIKAIDYMIVTHGHKDHVGGLSAVLASSKINVKNVIYNGTSYGSGNFRVFEHEVYRSGVNLITADDDKNNTFTLGGKVKFTQLGDTDRIPAYTREPDQSSSKDKKFMNHIVNNQSLVYRMDFDGTSMLFTGDAEGQKDGNGYNRQADILSKHKALVNVDVYKAAHHCHNNASNASFNSAMSPYYVMVSCGKKSEPHSTARKALSGADIWTTKGNGDAVVASLSRNSFRIVNGAGGDITRKPAYSHTVSTKSSFGTPNLSKAAFKASGKSVSALRNTSTRIGYYNPPKTGSIQVKVSPGWFYDRVQYQLCAGDRGMSNARWKSGSTATISGAFRGTVYFRLSNKYGRSIVCKTDGFETRTAVAAARGGRAVLTGYNDVMIDWYPVKGAKKYKVWYKKGKKWKSKGTTKAIYKSIKNVPSGKRVQFKIKPIGGSGTAYVSVVTLKKAAKPTVGKAGSVARVSWKAVAGGSGYQVAVNSKVKATTKGVRYASVKVAAGKKLKYKVRAYTVSNGRTIYGPWSKVRKYKL